MAHIVLMEESLTQMSSIYSYISYLPLAHIYERANQIMGVYGGVAVGFYQGVCKLMSCDI